MRKIDLTYRIIRIGKQVVSVAICALSGVVMMGASGSALAAPGEVWVNVGNNPDNATQAGGGAVSANASGDPAVEFRGEDVGSVTATVASGVNLDATNGVAVKDSTTTHFGISTTSLILSGNNTVNGSISADYTTINSGGVTGDGSQGNPYVIGQGATVSGALNTSSVTVNGKTAAALNGGLNGSLVLNNDYSYPYFTTTVAIGETGKSATSSIGSITTNLDGGGNVSFQGDGATSVGYLGSRGVAKLGTLNVSDAGNMMVYGTADVYNVNLNGSGTVTFAAADALNTNRAYANINSLQINGSSLAKLEGGLTGNVSFGVGSTGTAEIALNKDIVGWVYGSSSGTLDLKGYNNVYGSVSGLALVKAARDVNFWNPVYATETQVNGQNVTFHSTLTTALKYTAAGSAYLYEGVAGSVNFNGQNASLTLADGKAIVGAVDTSSNNSGTLIFEGAGTVTGPVGTTGALKEIQLNSTNAVTFGQSVRASVVNFNAAGTLNLASGVDASSSTNGRIDFNNYAGTVNLADGGSITGNIVSTGGSNAATANTANTLNFLGEATMNGNIGDSAANRIAQVNIGTAAEGGTTVTVNGDVYATAVSIQNDSTLQIGSGKNLTGVVTTTANGTGELVLQGGNQTVSDTVGASGMALGAVYAGAEGAVSNFSNASPVYANALVVGGTGTVNLDGGFSGMILGYLGDGTVNVAAGKDVNAAVDAIAGNIGTLSLLGGAQTVSGAIGASQSLKVVNAGADGASSAFLGDVHAQTFNVTGAGNVGLGGNLTGNLVYQGDGSVTLAGGKSLTGNVSNATGSDNRGSLVLAGGAQTVSGTVGADGAALKSISAGAEGSTSIFNGLVHVQNLSYAGDGTVRLNGTNGAAGGLIGNVDFGSNAGTLAIGNNVNLTVGAGKLNFQNEDAATLRFVGNSTVSGALGDAEHHFNTINVASAEGAAVTFADDVQVGSGKLNMIGYHGIANLNGNLDGELAYATNATVNVADGKSISGAVSTGSYGSGTLNFLGSAATIADIGSAGAQLRAINFHSDSEIGTATATLGSNLYATNINIGANTAATYTGNYEFGGTLALNAASSSLDLGTHSITGAEGAAFDLGSGTLKTTMTGARDADGSLHVTGFGKISADTFTNNADAKVAVTMPVGTWVMKDGDKFKLVDAGSGNAGAHTLNTGNVTTNSAVISFTALSGNDAGSSLNASTSTGGEDLWLVAHRVNADYATLVNVATTQPGGAAGARLTDIANGVIGSSTATTTDMRYVLSKFDSYSLAQMQPEVKKLAPVANASVSQSALGANTATLNTLSTRLAVLRGDSPLASNDSATGISAGDAPARNGMWMKGFGSWGKQGAKDGFDGYKTTTGGLVFGADTEVKRGVLGVALSYADSRVEQQDFRSGDNTKVKSYQLTGYGTQEYGRAYVDGMLSYAQHQYDSHRAAALGRTAAGDFNGTQLTAKVGGGYRMALQGKTVLTPLASLEWTRLRQDAYTETGADALNLAVDAQTTKRTRSGLGARVSGEMESGSTVYRPEVHAIWYHDFGSQNTDTTAAYAGGGAAFTTSGLALARNSANVGAGVTVMATKAASVQVLYDLDKRSGFTGHTGQVTARWSF